MAPEIGMIPYKAGVFIFFFHRPAFVEIPYPDGFSKIQGVIWMDSAYNPRYLIKPADILNSLLWEGVLLAQIRHPAAIFSAPGARFNLMPKVKWSKISEASASSIDTDTDLWVFALTSARLQVMLMSIWSYFWVCLSGQLILNCPVNSMFGPSLTQ